MIQVLDDSIDRVRQLFLFIQVDQVPEMATALVVGQTVLDISRNGGVNVSSGGFIISERNAFIVQLRIIEIRFSDTERSAIPDILINIVDTKEP